MVLLPWERGRFPCGFSFGLCASLNLLITLVNGMAVEEALYSLVRREDPYELRDYAANIQAETLVRGSFEDAGNPAFNRLFRYISGANHTAGKIAMTAPVSQQTLTESITMTLPVTQQTQEDHWLVSFMMPSGSTLENLPKPDDDAVKLRLVPAQRMAVVRYSGFWSSQRYQQMLMSLESWIQQSRLRATGAPVWARYNPPFTPWFLRRNEILIPIEESAN
jgi:hypothetical protein